MRVLTLEEMKQVAGGGKAKAGKSKGGKGGSKGGSAAGSKGGSSSGIVVPPPVPI